MQTPPFSKAAILTLVIVVATLASWEFFLRNKMGLSPDYDDGESLWSDKRAMVYEPSATTTVFIGSSRIKFDLDIATWQALTGKHAVQLAIEGASPRPILEDLANDENFKGNLVVDVTEDLFFSLSPSSDEEPNKNIAYYKKRTPAQRFSFQVNHALESQLVFLDKFNFSLNALLDRLRIPDRHDVLTMPVFPLACARITFGRQDIFTQRFLMDTSMQNEIKGIWTFFDNLDTAAPVSGDKLQAILNSVKASVDKIKARGGQVIFVRTPSSGHSWQREYKGYPRQLYWDRLLAFTGCPGIYFADYPPIAHFTCPEWSHLAQSDAVVYTNHLVQILRNKDLLPAANPRSN